MKEVPSANTDGGTGAARDLTGETGQGALPFSLRPRKPRGGCEEGSPMECNIEEGLTGFEEH